MHVCLQLILVHKYHSDINPYKETLVRMVKILIHKPESEKFPLCPPDESGPFEDLSKKSNIMVRAVFCPIHKSTHIQSLSSPTKPLNDEIKKWNKKYFTTFHFFRDYISPTIVSCNLFPQYWSLSQAMLIMQQYIILSELPYCIKMNDIKIYTGKPLFHAYLFLIGR